MNFCITVAKAFWEANFLNSMLGSETEGLSSQAMQQGGVGLLMTMLIVSVPPMAALFFNGTIGSFMTYSAFSSGAQANGSSVQRAGAATPMPANTAGANEVHRNSSPDGRSSGTPIKDEIGFREAR